MTFDPKFLENLFSANFDSISTGEDPPYLAAIHEMIVWLEIGILQPWRYALFSSKILIFSANLFNHMTFNYTVHAFKSLFKYHKAVFDIVKNRYNQLNAVSGDGKNQKINWKIVDSKRPSLLDSLLLKRVLQSDETHLGLFGKLWRRVSGFVDVMWHMDMFIVAGHDTSTASISWTLYMLAHHPQAQELAAREVRQYLEHLQKSDGQQPNQLNLKRLPYLECCIKEALRLHPVAPFLGRSALSDLHLQPQVDSHEIITIPAHVDVTVFYDYAHRQEKYFPQAGKFRPERYLETRTTFDFAKFKGQDLWWTKANRTSFPFSLGERGCLGQQYAMSQMKLLFVRLLSRYEIIPLSNSGEKMIHDEHHFLTKPPSFPVKFVRRA